jgi:hypothetical protein
MHCAWQPLKAYFPFRALRLAFLACFWALRPLHLFSGITVLPLAALLHRASLKCGLASC